MMLTATLALSLALIPAPRQDDDGPLLLMSFDQTIDKALAEAKRKNSFVFVALPEDWAGEGRGALTGSFWLHKGLRRAAEKGRAVVGSPSRHSDTDSGTDRDGYPMEHVCSRFGQMLCEHHNNIEKEVVARYFEGQDPPVRPLFLVLRGKDGAVIGRRIGDATATDMAELLKTAQAICETDAVVPSELLGRIDDSNEKTRTRAMRALASLEFEAADAARRKLLEEAKSDARRAELLNAMADCGARVSTEYLVSQLESKNASVRVAALRALGGPGTAAGVEPLLKAFPKARDDEERKAIVRSLGRCSRAAEAGRELLKRALNDAKSLVRANAAIGLAEAAWSDPATQKTLRAKIETDGEARVRGAAVFALITMRGIDTREMLTWLRARKPKEKDPKVVELISNGIAQLEGSQGDELRWPLEIFCGDAER